MFTKGLAFQRRNCKEPVETVTIQLVISLFVEENAFASGNLGFGGVKLTMPPNELLALVDKLYFFSYVWTVGAATSSVYWEAFSDHARELFEEDCPQLGVPGRGLVFDYFVDMKEMKFKEWGDVVPSFEYNDAVPYFDLVVPTSDTVRFSYVMKALITVDKPCFITGVTGTGKTVCMQTLLNGLQPMPYDGGMGLVLLFLNFSA